MTLFKRFLLVVTGIASSLMLMGFSGQEKYIELEGYFYGRENPNFRSQDKNIDSVLKTGTRAEILSHKQLPSGNYGLQVKVMSGVSAGKTLWVYYNNKNPDIALYEKAPQNWETGSQAVRTTNVEKAQGMKTLRETPAVKPPAPVVAKPAPRPATPSADTAQVRNALTRINHSNEVVRTAGTPPCVNCSLPTTSGQTLRIRPGSKGMDPACSMMMSSSGQMGAVGRSVFSIMSEPQNKQFYTRSDALGGFCPKFRTLTPTERLQAWTWFWTALAQEESSCNPKLRHPTHYRDGRGRLAILNPREGFGMWAMEKDANIRRNRGAACSNIASAEGQARCSIEIMRQTQLAKGRNADVRSGSYWGPVMRGQSQIMPHMRRLSLCF